MNNPQNTLDAYRQAVVDADQKTAPVRKRPKLFIALDDLSQNTGETLTLAQSLREAFGNHRFGFKVNLDFLANPLMRVADVLSGLAGGFDGEKPSLFLDFKMFNGGRTMASLVKSYALLKARDLLRIDYTNAHVMADKEIVEVLPVATEANIKVLGLTVMSHYNDSYCLERFGRGLLDQIRWETFHAFCLGYYGVIVPGAALGEIADGPIFKCATGIRPAWFSDERHANPITPRQAAQLGADMIVCGSPITKSADPIKATELILEELEGDLPPHSE